MVKDSNPSLSMARIFQHALWYRRENSHGKFEVPSGYVNIAIENGHL